MDDSPQFKVRRHPGDFDKIVVNEVSISLAEARELIAKLDEAIDIQVRRERKAREMRCGEPVLFGSEFTGRLTIL